MAEFDPPTIHHKKRKLRLENITGMKADLDQCIELKISDCTLELAGDQVPIADAIRKMKNLNTLQLERIDLHSSTFLEIESKKLKKLHLCWSKTPLQIASIFKNDLCYKDSLVELHLDGNDLSEVPNGIFQFRNLLKLSLESNCITELPDKFIKLPKLQVLDLYNNQISHLPSSIFALQNLSELNIMVNLISELPVIINLPKLNTLDVSNSELRYVPSSIFTLQNLCELSMHFNHITEIPDMFANLSKLQVLSLCDNELRSLPPSIFLLQNLSQLNIGGNFITELPDKFTNLPKLKDLSLENNQLLFLPPSICSLHLSYLNIAENDEFYFRVPPSVESEKIVHSLKELTYRTILNLKLKVKEGMLPEKFLKDLDNYQQCVCGCKFVDEGQHVSFSIKLNDISRFTLSDHQPHLRAPIRGKMCTSLKSCFLDRFTKCKNNH